MIRNGIEDVTDEIQKNVNAIINIFAYHEEANPKAAQEEIDAMMNILVRFHRTKIFMLYEKMIESRNSCSQPFKISYGSLLQCP